MRTLLALWILISAWPALAGPSSRELIEVADLSSPAISPDGRMVAYRQDQAYIEANRHDLSWWITNLDGKTPPRRIAGGGEAIWADYGVLPAEAPQWSPDGRAIYFRALIAGQVQVWRASIDGVARQMTSDEADVQEFSLVDQGVTLVYAAGATREAVRQAEARQYETGVRIDASIDPGQALFAAMPVNGRLASQRFVGRWFDHATLLGDQPRRYQAYDLARQTVRTATAREIAASRLEPRAKPPLLSAAGIAAASPAGHGLAQVVGDGLDQKLLVQRLDGVSRTCEIAACRARITALTWRGQRDEVVVTTIDPARRRTLIVWNVARDKVRLVHTNPGMLDGGGVLTPPCATDDRAAVCIEAAATVPPRLIAIDLDRGAPTLLAEPNAMLARHAAMVEPLQWADASGRLFTGQLVRPSARKPERPWPLFVTYYLCDGFLRGGEGDEWPLAVLADAGVAALCINKTPSPPGAFDAVADYRAAQSGIEAAVDLLARRGLADRKRVGMGGLSFGSEVTTWMAMNSSILAAASIASTQVEPTYYWANAYVGRDVPEVLRRAWGLGPPGETPQTWRAISPALNTDRIRSPLLIQIPEQEYRMIPEFLARLSRSSTPMEAYAFPHEPHVLTQPRHRAAAYERNLDWFRFWLQDHVDPDPAKAEQYRRWRAMKDQRPNTGQSSAP